MNKDVKDTLCVLSYVYLMHGKYEAAIALLKSILIFHPNDIDSLRCLAYSCLKFEDYQSALQYAELCLKANLDKDSISAIQIIKSKALWALGKEEAARHTLNIATYSTDRE